jgi:hypothetical protein
VNSCDDEESTIDGAVEVVLACKRLTDASPWSLVSLLASTLYLPFLAADGMRVMMSTS